jgi:FHS family L-fucose permease-like MFS transporter
VGFISILYSIYGRLYYLFVNIKSYWCKDLLNKLGYKNGIAFGLNHICIRYTYYFTQQQTRVHYGLMLTGLFVVALGFSLQQIAANPLTVVMGDPKTGSQRLSYSWWNK